MKSSSHQTNVAPPDHLRTMASVTKDDDETEVTVDETEVTLAADSSSTFFYPFARKSFARKMEDHLTNRSNHSSETVARKTHTNSKRPTDPGCHPVNGRQRKLTEEEVKAKTKKQKNHVLPGAYFNKQGQVSLRLGAHNKSALVQASGGPKLQHCSSSSTDSPPNKKNFLLPEAIPITAEVVEAEEDRKRKSNIRTTIFHQEVHQQRDFYETKLAALAAKLEAAECSKESELEALEEENEALRAENLKLKAATGIQATIFQKEQQQQREYYKSQMERAQGEAQKLKRTLRKMKTEQERHEEVIGARVIDQARQKIYALQARWEHKMAAMEQAQQAALQGVKVSKDQELDQAKKVIAQLRQQLGLPSVPNVDEQTPIMLNNVWQ